MKQYIKKIAVVFLFLACVIQMSGCSASKGFQPSQATSTQFLQKMKARAFSAAHSLLSAQCKSTTPAQQLKNYWDLVVKNKGQVQSWSQQGVNFSTGTRGNFVTLKYGLQCSKGSAGVGFICIEENGKWLIHGFNFRA